LRPFALRTVASFSCNVNQLGGPWGAQWYYFQMLMRCAVLAGLLCAGSAALAQQYRWVDDQGRPHYSDTPPAKAKTVTKAEAKAPRTPEGPPPPYEVQRAMKDFPVTLYTAPICKQPCELARAALNGRGVPFTEVQVWNAETLEQLKSRTGSGNVPTLVVGRSVMNGFDQASYDDLLNSAGYPRPGAVPARAQRAPAPPEGYEPPPGAEPRKPEAVTAVKPRPYDPSGLQSDRTGKQGPYRVPDDAK